MSAFRFLALASLLLGSVTFAQGNPPRPDETPPVITQWTQSPAILVYSKTIDWRHNEGIAGADRFFVELADANGMGIFTTVNGAVFNPEQLSRFEVVVFNNVTGETLTDGQEEALQTWIEKGGAFVALHGAGDHTHSSWPWFDEEVIGPEFIGHPQGPQMQEARLVNLAAEHPIMQGVPSEWRHTGEWYSFDSTEKLADAAVLLGIDEDSYIPEIRVGGEVKDIRMGGGPESHPLIWARCIADGRTFYSAIGHSHKSYDDPIYQRLLGNAFAWVRKRDEAREGCPVAR